MLVVILAVVLVVAVARISWAGGNKRQNHCGVWCQFLPPAVVVAGGISAGRQID